MGENFWTYGFNNNLNTLDKLCQYSYDQGLAKKRVNPARAYFGFLVGAISMGMTFLPAAKRYFGKA